MCLGGYIGIRESGSKKKVDPAGVWGRFSVSSSVTFWLFFLAASRLFFALLIQLNPYMVTSYLRQPLPIKESFKITLFLHDYLHNYYNILSIIHHSGTVNPLMFRYLKMN
jgi:hypothetical protein